MEALYLRESSQIDLKKYVFENYDKFRFGSPLM